MTPFYFCVLYSSLFHQPAATVARVMEAHKIRANLVSGLYCDHLFIPLRKAEDAVKILQAMAAQPKSQLETSGKRLPVRSNSIYIHGISGISSWSVTVRVIAEAGMTEI